jgi:hypothetical protein
MTAAEWLACHDPTLMLESMRDKVSCRKMRLFALGCCRRFCDPTTNEDLRTAIAWAEQRIEDTPAPTPERDPWFANFRAPSVEWWFPEQEEEEEPAIYLRNADGSQQEVNLNAIPGTLAQRLRAVASTVSDLWNLNWLVDLRHDGFAAADQAELLREVMHGRRRPPDLRAFWNALHDDAVRGIARAIYDDHAFDRLPILGDALLDAGCDDASMLEHCREPGPHVRGCWLVDLLTGRR